MVEWDGPGADPFEYLTFKGRTKLDIETGDVTILKLTKDDSGEYVAEVVIGSALRSLTYEVEVIDPVTKPEITCTSSECITRSNEPAVTTENEGNRRTIIGALCGALGVGVAVAVAVVGVFFCHKRKTKGHDANEHTEEKVGLTSAGNEKDLQSPEEHDGARHHADTPSIERNIDESPCDYNKTKGIWEAKVMTPDNKQGPPKKQTSESKKQKLPDTEESFTHEPSARNYEKDAGPCSTDEIHQQNGSSSDCSKQPGNPKDGLSVPVVNLSSGVGAISPDGEVTPSTQEPHAALKGPTAASKDEKELQTEQSSGNQHVPDTEAKPAAASKDENELKTEQSNGDQHVADTEAKPAAASKDENELKTEDENELETEQSSGNQHVADTEAKPVAASKDENELKTEDENELETEQSSGNQQVPDTEAKPAAASKDENKLKTEQSNGDQHVADTGAKPAAASKDENKLETEQSSVNQNVPDTEAKPAAASKDENELKIEQSNEDQHVADTEAKPCTDVKHPTFKEPTTASMEEKDPGLSSCTDGARHHAGSPSIDRNIDDSSFDYHETKGIWEAKVMATDKQDPGVGTIPPDAEVTHKKSTQEAHTDLKGSTAASKDEKELQTEAQLAAASKDEKEEDPGVISSTAGAHQHTGSPSESSTPPTDNEEALSESRLNQSDDSSGDQNVSNTEETPCIDKNPIPITEENIGPSGRRNSDDTD
ncbi:nuclear receptor corepressor 2-like isoform X2 [Sardina pilchardus]|uniref:nuclear receptor corepressor 2-like isoform X2 n=1 Tax=Sardina pilchardus TaxID=27697 RepID=UPI002E1365CB